jgi:hypothetical protein
MAKNIFVVLFICLLTGCLDRGIGSSKDDADNMPACIKVKIEEIKTEDARNPPASVYRYNYQRKKVYFIPQYCCDLFSDLLDENCNLICHPDGGITGKGDGKCTDFLDTRTGEELIWKDERSQ